MNIIIIKIHYSKKRIARYYREIIEIARENKEASKYNYK